MILLAQYILPIVDEHIAFAVSLVWNAVLVIAIVALVEELKIREKDNE